MGKFDGILFCTDLDGTLYRNDKTISSENKNAIEYFKREGGLFTFITGRLPYYSSDAYAAIQPNAPYGCTNGGGVYDGERGEYIWALSLPDEWHKIVSDVESLCPNVGVELCAFDTTYFAKESSATVWHRSAVGLENITCDYKTFSAPVGKILFCTDYEDEILGVERALREHPLADRFDFIRSERVMFEVLPKGASKGLALAKLSEHLKIDKKRTVAIGDYNNDVSMILAAGVGIAVANASEAALRAADIVTVSNEEHAIARVISDLESGKILKSLYKSAL